MKYIWVPVLKYIWNGSSNNATIGSVNVICYNISDKIMNRGIYMKFELNEYHRNVSDAEFIEDVKKTAKILGEESLTADNYSTHGKYHSSTLRRRFGTWKKVLELCNLETHGHNFEYNFTEEDVIQDLHRVAEILKKDTLTMKDYNLYGEYHSNTIMRRYGSWNTILNLAGMKVNLNRNFTNEEMFEEIERVWIMLGRQPTTMDIKKGISKYSLNSYARRFGGWRGALQSFVDYINAEPQNVDDLDERLELNEIKLPENNIQYKSHRTNREVNLRLRFMVMQRDNFKCCACGTSPVKDSSVKLHIDHIKPWSKGGETVIENLQSGEVI